MCEPRCATQTCILFVCLLFSEISNNREYHQVESGGSDADSFAFVEYTDKVIYICIYKIISSITFLFPPTLSLKLLIQFQ